MIDFLFRYFTGKEKGGAAKVPSRTLLGVLCGAVGVFFNALLFGLKLLAGVVSNSISITADAFNNLSDAASSAVTLAGFRFSGQGPDRGHPYGHGRAEYLAGLAVAGIILIMSFELLRTSVGKILHPDMQRYGALSLLILVGSILVKLYMFSYNRRIGRRIDSPALRAAAMDSLGDAAATSVVLVSAAVSRYTGGSLDGWAGLLVALLVGWAGIDAAKDTINPLLGEPPSEGFVQKVKEIVLSHPQVMGVHDLLVHDYGPGRTMISLHAEVPATGELLQIHNLIDGIEHQLSQELSCSALIHMDPVAVEDEETARARKTMEDAAAGLDAEASIHDFHLLRKDGEKVLSFDVSIPYHFRMGADQIQEALERAANAADPAWHVQVNVDQGPDELDVAQ